MRSFRPTPSTLFLSILSSILPLFLPFLFFSALLQQNSQTSAYKVLVYSQTLTRSHVILNAKVAEALASDGHNVTILEVEYFEPLADFDGSSARNVRKISVKSNLSKERKSVDEHLANIWMRRSTIWSIVSAIRTDELFQEKLNEFCKEFLDTQDELIKQLRTEKFDVFFGEQINFCGSLLSHLLEIPIHILLVSCPIQEHVSSMLGLPFPASYVPSIYGIPMEDRMSLKQRFENLVATLVYEHFFLYGAEHLTEIFRQRFGVDFPHARDIVKESPLVFVNVDEFVEFPRPIHSNVIYIGGLEFEQRSGNNNSSSSPDQLEEPYRSEMEKGKRGVVYFSLGSLVNTAALPREFLRNLFAAFRELEEWHVVMKISKNDELSRELARSMVKNVFLTDWAPQKAILSHPRTKLFISHGGYNSLMEAAIAGCPVLSFGFFAEQRRNGNVPQRNGWGLRFENWYLLEGSAEFVASVRTILDEPKFARGAKRLSKLLASKPFTAREKLLKHIRFLEQSDGRLPELMPESRNMSVVALYNLDIYALLGVAITILLSIVFALLKLCLLATIKRIRRRKLKPE